jgi:hypothetical protein
MIGNQAFRVPSVSDRLMISTLQRMYRHFYFRLCDIVDTAASCRRQAALTTGPALFSDDAGIWEGVATYLVIVSDYVRKYSGSGLDLPQFVIAAARFGGDEVYYADSFCGFRSCRNPPGSTDLNLPGCCERRELQNWRPTQLLPWLATAAWLGKELLEAIRAFGKAEVQNSGHLKLESEEFDCFRC